MNPDLIDNRFYMIGFNDGRHGKVFERPIHWQPDEKELYKKGFDDSRK